MTYIEKLHPKFPVTTHRCVPSTPTRIKLGHFGWFEARAILHQFAEKIHRPRSIHERWVKCCAVPRICVEGRLSAHSLSVLQPHILLPIVVFNDLLLMIIDLLLDIYRQPLRPHTPLQTQAFTQRKSITTLPRS